MLLQGRVMKIVTVWVLLLMAPATSRRARGQPVFSIGV